MHRSFWQDPHVATSACNCHRRALTEPHVNTQVAISQRFDSFKITPSSPVNRRPVAPPRTMHSPTPARGSESPQAGLVADRRPTTSPSTPDLRTPGAPGSSSPGHAVSPHTIKPTPTAPSPVYTRVSGSSSPASPYYAALPDRKYTGGGGSTPPSNHGNGSSPVHKVDTPQDRNNSAYKQQPGWVWIRQSGQHWSNTRAALSGPYACTTTHTRIHLLGVGTISEISRQKSARHKTAVTPSRLAVMLLHAAFQIFSRNHQFKEASKKKVHDRYIPKSALWHGCVGFCCCFWFLFWNTYFSCLRWSTLLVGTNINHICIFQGAKNHVRMHIYTHLNNPHIHLHAHASTYTYTNMHSIHTHTHTLSLSLSVSLSLSLSHVHTTLTYTHKKTHIGTNVKVWMLFILLWTVPYHYLEADSSISIQHQCLEASSSTSVKHPCLGANSSMNMSMFSRLLRL